MLRACCVELVTFFILALSCVNSAFAMTHYSCNYPIYSDESGVQASKQFKLQFLHDDKNDKAYVVGNQGRAEVLAIVGFKAISFIEITATKNVITTTIVNEKKTVHSRNITLLGKLVASQYYGSCEVVKR